MVSIGGGNESWRGNAPVGTGQIDFKRVFASASVAGLKHFALEHDNAAAWGDSLAAARVSYRNLVQLLS